MFKINKLVIAVLLVLSASVASAQVQLSPGQPEVPVSSYAGAAPATSNSYSIPNAVNQITWIVTFVSAPISHTTILETSNDNSVWATADTSSNTGGESRNIFTAARFVRVTLSAKSGGGAVTVSIIGKTTSIGALSANTTLGGGLTLGSGQLLIADGTVSSPGLALSAVPSTGLYNLGGNLAFAVGSAARAGLFSIGFQMRSDAGLVWAGGNVNTATDTGITRLAANSVAVGNGIAADTSGTITTTNGNFGTLRLTGGANQISSVNGAYALVNSAASIGSVIKVDALPTVASGFGTSPAITAGSTPFAGSVNVGTGGIATSGNINFNGTAFPSAPFCVLTTNSATGVPNVSSSTTQLVIGTSVAWPASTIVYWHCASAK